MKPVHSCVFFIVCIVFLLYPVMNPLFECSSVSASGEEMRSIEVSMCSDTGETSEPPKGTADSEEAYLLSVTPEQAEKLDEKDKVELLKRYLGAYSSLYTGGSRQRAFELILKAHQIFPAEQAIALNASGGYAMMNDWEKSLQFALKVIDEKSPQLRKGDNITIMAAAHNNAAQAYLKMKNLDKGIEHLKKALELQPDMGGSNYLMGQALTEAGKCKESIDFFRKAFSVSPGTANPEDYSYYGYSLGKCEKRKEATEIAKSGMERYPLYPGMHFNYASMLSAENRYAEAIYELHVEILLFRGSGRDDTDNALRFMAGLINEVRNNPKNADHEEVSLLYESIRKSSPDKVEKLIEISSTKPFLLNVFLAEAYTGAGNYGKAKLLYQKVLAEAPYFVPAYVELGEIYEKEKDTDNATMLYKKAVKLMPDNWKVKALLKEHPELSPK
ncbi:MAG: tetratricopeptide repeat protein [Vulcanimicrobiota bacterium]